MNREHVIVGSAICIALAVAPAWAVKTKSWTHEQPAHFLAGKLENVVVSSQGEVMLGREIKVLHEAEDEAEVINALAQAGDGLIYAATGPNGIIYKIDGEKVSRFATLPDGGSALSLLFDKNGKLLVGTGGGDQAKIYTIDGRGRARVFHEPQDARYVWAMARGPRNQIYAATGIEGQLHVIDADGKTSKVLADIKPKNILCLAYGPDNMLYAGTDEDGLIYRINPTTGGLYVMYDAKEPEISAIVVDHQGNVFASTAWDSQARPGRAVADKPGGKPDRADEERHEGTAETRPSGKSGKSNDDNGNKKKEKAEEELKTRALKIASTQRGRIAGVTAGAGNAIYRIDADGFVTEVFREPVMILAMAEDEGILYAATGNEGRLYTIAIDDDRTTMIAKLEPNQATALLHLPSGRLVVGTANAPTLVRVSEGYASKGTLVSKPLDARQIVKWGRLVWDANVPNGTKLTVATRSGNVEDEEADTWDTWSAEMNATVAQQVASPGARFLQYRLTFESSDPSATAILRKLTAAWIEENRPPQIIALRALSAQDEAKQPSGGSPKVKALVGSSGFGQKSKPGPESHWVVKWKAADPNNDRLRYEVFFRASGTRRWVQMAKKLKELLCIWDTRTVPDGTYETRVVADDSLDNPSGTELKDARISDTIIVDNTAPDVTIDQFERRGKDALAIQVTITDALSPIAGASYSVDSSEEWVPVAAADDVFDSLSESLIFTIDDLESGEHWITLRVSDQQGNTRYVSRSASIEN